MISLKKHIDDWTVTEGHCAVAKYGSLLLTMGSSGSQAVPDLGTELESKLAGLAEGLARNPDAETLSGTHELAKTEISRWAEKAHEHHADSERELKAIVLAMAKAIESVTERDGRYAREVGELTERLRSIATLNDLSAIRRSIMESANALTVCVQRIAEDSQASLHRLSAEVEEYRARLEKSETLSTLDSLTGLANRRRFEELLEGKLKGRDIFSLILIDLNGFKSVNDRFGHLAGDTLLKQFAGELRAQFQMADLVARWGGDEFVIIVASSQKDTAARLHRLRRKVLGDYKVRDGARTITIPVGASIGVVEWDGRESGHDLLSRADYCMYSGKQSTVAIRTG